MIPLQWRLYKQKYTLAGTRCGKCSACYYPARNYCPECGNADMIAGTFSGRGVVESFTTIFSAPAKFRAPYNVVVIRLEEGPKIAALLVGRVSQDIIGRNVKTVFRKISQHDKQNVISYGLKFELAE